MKTEKTCTPADPRKPSFCSATPVPFSPDADLSRFSWFVRDPTGTYHYDVKGCGTCPDAETAVRYAFECEGPDLGEEQRRLRLIARNLSVTTDTTDGLATISASKTTDITDASVKSV